MAKYRPIREDPLGLYPKCLRCWGVMKLHAEPRGRLAKRKCLACGFDGPMEVQDGLQEGQGQEEGGGR